MDGRKWELHQLHEFFYVGAVCHHFQLPLHSACITAVHSEITWLAHLQLEEYVNITCLVLLVLNCNFFYFFFIGIA